MNAAVDFKVQTSTATVENILSLLRNEAEFEKYFKKKAFTEELGKGFWLPDGKKGFRCTFEDGSYIRIKFFDTIKLIFNSKNVEVPGRESFLSYIDVVVAPAGVKAYTFTMDMAQHVWAMTPGKKRPPAKDTHAESIAKLIMKGAALGIDLTVKTAWDDMFVKHFPKRGD